MRMSRVVSVTGFGAFVRICATASHAITSAPPIRCANGAPPDGFAGAASRFTAGRLPRRSDSVFGANAIVGLSHRRHQDVQRTRIECECPLFVVDEIVIEPSRFSIANCATVIVTVCG